jgi:1,2-diacylglycerol 3-beta-glucosyltransferase
MLVEALLVAMCAPVLACSGYLFLLTLCSARPRPPAVPDAATTPPPRLVAIVPAHDERVGIAATVQSLLAADYPRDRRRVLVVADNCTDDTAALARASGADVLERHDDVHRGKGYALAAAFAAILDAGDADGVTVVDADTRVTPNFLAALGARLASGADAVQSGNAVGNADASWRTRLLAIAFALFNDLRSIGRERLGLSCGLRGNGMALSVRVLREVPYDAFSLVEDLEYGLRLGQAGRRVRYAGEAQVRSEMVTGERASRSQRRRWEEGRRQLARAMARRLVVDAFRKRSGLLFDLAADLLVPPLSALVVAACAGLAAATAARAYGLVGLAPVVAWAACLAMIAAYVSRGVLLSGAGARGFLDLAAAPVYVAWKLALRLRPAPRTKDTWVRTAREGEDGPPGQGRRP